MGIIGIIGKIATSKIIEKVEDNLEKKQNREQTIKYSIYVNNNLVRIRNDIANLQEETVYLNGKILEKKDLKMTLREKEEFRKFKEKAYTNLKYLYLSRDFFAILSKNVNGVELNNEELMLVIKFAPYFDGSPVIAIDNERDDSLLGAFKEVGQEFKTTFISSKGDSKHFKFNEYLLRYNGKILEGLLPDVNSAIDSFENSMISQTCFEATDSEAVTSNIEPNIGSVEVVDEIECKSCHIKLNTGCKFCPNCGNKIEVNKIMFCTQCGEPLAVDSKFCSNCGSKI